MIRVTKFDLRATSKAAIKTFGVRNQLRQVQEECAELIAAINHYLRDSDKENKISLLNEIADVVIMLEQLKVIYGDVNIQIALNVKLSRLRELIDASVKK